MVLETAVLPPSSILLGVIWFTRLFPHFVSCSQPFSRTWQPNEWQQSVEWQRKLQKVHAFLNFSSEVVLWMSSFNPFLSRWFYILCHHCQKPSLRLPSVLVSLLPFNISHTGQLHNNLAVWTFKDISEASGGSQGFALQSFRSNFTA